MVRNLSKSKVFLGIMPFAILFSLALLGIVMLKIVSFIPQSLLTKNVEEGNEVITSNNMSFMVENDYGTFIDDFTDHLKVNIAYGLNEHSVLAPCFRVTEDQVSEYGRYWHGYAIVIRPLLLFLNLAEIRMLFGIILGVVFCWLLILLYRNNAKLLVIALPLAAFLSNHWVALNCIQYFNCTLLAMLFSILLIKCPKLYYEQKMLTFFTFGIIVNYFDFLTFESLTLSLPLLCVEFVCVSDCSIAKRTTNIIKVFFSWLIGYLAMFGCKWFLYSMVSSGVGDEIKYKTAQRLVGTSEGYTIGETLMMNITKLKYADKHNWFSISVILLIFTVACLYLFRGIKAYEKYLSACIVGFIPIIRFILIREHSATHSAFAYHALFVTVTAYLLLAGMLIVMIGQCAYEAGLIPVVKFKRSRKL